MGEPCSGWEPPWDRRRFAPPCEQVEPKHRALHLLRSPGRKQQALRGFHGLRGAGDRGRPLTARRRLFMEASTSDPADCTLSASDYLPMETCFYVPRAPVIREDRQRLTVRVAPAAEMMQSRRDNWQAVGSCLMGAHFANLSGSCGVRAAEAPFSSSLAQP